VFSAKYSLLVNGKTLNLSFCAEKFVFCDFQSLERIGLQVANYDNTWNGVNGAGEDVPEGVARL
jgi:hypothetical protein